MAIGFNAKDKPPADIWLTGGYRPDSPVDDGTRHVIDQLPTIVHGKSPTGQASH